MITFSQLGRLGRFANGLFEIAGTIGIAIKSGQTFSFPLWKNHDAVERFGSTEDINVQDYFINKLPITPDVLHFQKYGYWWGYRDIYLPQGNWDLGGHMQSDKYFLHCIDTVRYYFTMFGEMKYESTAIHMRYGDYDDSYHPRPKIDYYREALARVPGPYLLFSDNLDLATSMLDEIGVKYTPIQKDYIESFRIMKGCKHFICGNSSYSMMAAILADQPGKMITAPKKWFGDFVQLETADLYPENCIVI